MLDPDVYSLFEKICKLLYRKEPERILMSEIDKVFINNLETIEIHQEELSPEGKALFSDYMKRIKKAVTLTPKT